MEKLSLKSPLLSGQVLPLRSMLRFSGSARDGGSAASHSSLSSISHRHGWCWICSLLQAVATSFPWPLLSTPPMSPRQYLGHPMTHDADGDDDGGAGTQGRSLALPGAEPQQVSRWIHGFTQLHLSFPSSQPGRTSESRLRMDQDGEIQHEEQDLSLSCLELRLDQWILWAR